MPTAPPRLQIDAADAHHTHHQVIVVPRRILPLRRRRIPRPRRLLRCNPCVAGDPDGSSRHHHRCLLPLYRGMPIRSGRLYCIWDPHRAPPYVPGGIMRGFFLMVLSSRRHFSYAGFEQQPKKFVSPKILLLNIEQELKYEKENAEISLHLLKCPIVVKGDNTLAWMMPRFVGFEGKNVEYSTRSAYQIQFLGEIRFIWEGKAEGKCKFFMWLTAQRKILTTDKLQLRG
uniref:Reverse transcriptase zinc-binding domain-containing protein n=1 Tax=Oryza nivara TaxID=4536 RepID=A0A0E0HKH5_ORYNI